MSSQFALWEHITIISISSQFVWGQTNVISRLRIGTLIWWRATLSARTWIHWFTQTNGPNLPTNGWFTHLSEFQCCGLNVFGVKFRLKRNVVMNVWPPPHWLTRHQISVPIRNLEMTAIWSQRRSQGEVPRLWLRIKIQNPKLRDLLRCRLHLFLLIQFVILTNTPCNFKKYSL